MRRRGFTLTEILIVIALIVLMLGLAVPAFNLVRGSRSVDGPNHHASHQWLPFRVTIDSAARIDAMSTAAHQETTHV